MIIVVLKSYIIFKRDIINYIIIFLQKTIAQCTVKKKCSIFVNTAEKNAE